MSEYERRDLFRKCRTERLPLIFFPQSSIFNLMPQLQCRFQCYFCDTPCSICTSAICSVYCTVTDARSFAVNLLLQYFLQYCYLTAVSCVMVATGSLSRGEDVAVYVWHKPNRAAHFFHSVLVSVSVFMALSTVLHFHKFSRQLSAFSLCSFGLISALLVLSTKYLFMKVSLSPDIILCGWLGWN